MERARGLGRGTAAGSRVGAPDRCGGSGSCPPPLSAGDASPPGAGQTWLGGAQGATSPHADGGDGARWGWSGGSALPALGGPCCALATRWAAVLALCRGSSADSPGAGHAQDGPCWGARAVRERGAASRATEMPVLLVLPISAGRQDSVL